MIKVLFSTVFLLVLCTARITLPIEQSQGISRENAIRAFFTADDERNTTNPKKLNLTVNNHENLYYYTDIYVGGNTTMKVLLETRTNNLWLPDSDFLFAFRQKEYDCSASLSCDKDTKSQKLTYYLKDILGYSNTFSGNSGHEIIGFTQDFKVKSSVLWVNDVSPKPFVDEKSYYFDQVDGFMGLGSNESSDCFIDQAYEQNYIQEKVFSFYLDSNRPNSYGGDSTESSLSIGYIPEEKVNQLNWIPIDSSSSNSWTMSFSSLKIGDKVIDTSSDAFPNKISIDSGSPYILLPHSVFQEFDSQIQNTPFITGYSGQTYLICNDNYTDSYPKITFKLDNMDIVIDANTYLSFEEFRRLENNKVFCRLLAVTSNMSMPILGNPFLRNYFVAFSKRNQTVGVLPDVKKTRFGNIKVPFKVTWVHIAGAVGLILAIIVACVVKRNQKAETLKQKLNDDEQSRSEVFYSQVA